RRWTEAQLTTHPLTRRTSCTIADGPLPTDYLKDLALRQEADHGLGEGVRLFDVGNMRGIEDRQGRAWNLAADELAGRDRGRYIVASGDDKRRALDLWQWFALIERAQRLATR